MSSNSRHVAERARPSLQMVAQRSATNRQSLGSVLAFKLLLLPLAANFCSTVSAGAGPGPAAAAASSCSGAATAPLWVNDPGE